MALTRREFVCRSFASFGAAVWALERFGLLQALAQAGDYKALVCIFLFGGNDSGNMLIPYDDYATYAAVRQNAGLAIPQSGLLPINRTSGRPRSPTGRAPPAGVVARLTRPRSGMRAPARWCYRSPGLPSL